MTYTAAVDTVRAALPHLEASGGTIVVTGSIMTRVPLPTFGSYAAAKHALRGFLGSLRMELLEAGSPVTVSMVHPGAVDMPLWGHVTAADGASRATRPTPTRPRSWPRRRGVRDQAARGDHRRPRGARHRGAVHVGAAGRRPDPDGGSTGPRQRQGAGAGAGGRGSADEGRASGGLHGRPSLWAALRLGTRLLPPY